MGISCGHCQWANRKIDTEETVSQGVHPAWNQFRSHIPAHVFRRGGRSTWTPILLRTWRGTEILVRLGVHRQHSVRKDEGRQKTVQTRQTPHRFPSERRSVSMALVHP